MLRGKFCHGDYYIGYVYVGGETLVFVFLGCRKLSENQQHISPCIKSFFVVYSFAGDTVAVSYKHERQILFSSSGRLLCTIHRLIK